MFDIIIGAWGLVHKLGHPSQEKNILGNFFDSFKFLRLFRKTKHAVLHAECYWNWASMSNEKLDWNPVENLNKKRWKFENFKNPLEI